MNKISIFVAAVALGATHVMANDLVITELNENIVATYNGSSISPTLTGPQNGWTIELPSGFSLSIVGNVYYLGEPENASTYNQVAVTQPTFLTWDSDVSGVPPGGPFPATTTTIPNAGTYNSSAFDLTIADIRSSSVPEGGSTALLMGLSAVGMMLAARRKATA